MKATVPEAQNSPLSPFRFILARNPTRKTFSLDCRVSFSRRWSLEWELNRRRGLGESPLPTSEKSGKRSRKTPRLCLRFLRRCSRRGSWRSRRSCPAEIRDPTGEPFVSCRRLKVPRGSRAVAVPVLPQRVAAASGRNLWPLLGY